MILGFVGCHQQPELQPRLTKETAGSHQATNLKTVTLSHFLHELASNPSAIYGDVFTNKAWN